MNAGSRAFNQMAASGRTQNRPHLLRKNCDFCYEFLQLNLQLICNGSNEVVPLGIA